MALFIIGLVLILGALAYLALGMFLYVLLVCGWEYVIGIILLTILYRHIRMNFWKIMYTIRDYSQGIIAIVIICILELIYKDKLEQDMIGYR